MRQAKEVTNSVCSQAWKGMINYVILAVHAKLLRRTSRNPASSLAASALAAAASAFAASASRLPHAYMDLKPHLDRTVDTCHAQLSDVVTSDKLR